MRIEVKAHEYTVTGHYGIVPVHFERQRSLPAP
jgi:hypothetical protein